MARAFVSMILAVSLTTTSAPGVTPVGVIIHAARAHVGVGTASAGTTLYEGDRVSTDTEGELGIRVSSVTLQLQQEASLTLGRVAPGERGIAVDLGSGTLILSAYGGSAVVVTANRATVRAADDGPMITHLRVVGPKELRIFAQRGALEFSYGGDRELITEGACYRILLDDPDQGPAPGSVGAQGRKIGTKRVFVFISIAVGAAVAAAVAHSHDPHPHPHESPDRP